MYDHVGVSWLSLIILDPEIKRQEPPGTLAAPVATLHPTILARSVSACRLQKLKSVTYTEIKKEHQTGRNGNGICGWALRNCLQDWVVRNLSRGFLCVCPRHLSQEQYKNNAFTSTSSVHFSEFWGRKTYNEREKKIVKTVQKQTHTHAHTQSIRSIFLVLGDFPVEDRERSFSLWRVLCEEHNWFLRTPIPKTQGKCWRPTCADDILKSYGGVVSCPSYSKANMWRRHYGCLVAQSCPSWLGESPREVYLIWCLRRNKQINGTLLHNTLLSFPLLCIPSVIAALATKTRIRGEKKKGTKSSTRPIDGESVQSLQIVFDILSKKKQPLTFPRVKLRQCDHVNFRGPMWILRVWIAGSAFIKTE